MQEKALKKHQHPDLNNSVFHFNIRINCVSTNRSFQSQPWRITHRPSISSLTYLWSWLTLVSVSSLTPHPHSVEIKPTLWAARNKSFLWIPCQLQLSPVGWARWGRWEAGGLQVKLTSIWNGVSPPAAPWHYCRAAPVSESTVWGVCQTVPWRHTHTQ